MDDILVQVSHPVWVRGLKLYLRLLFINEFLSHPVWVRGLKHGPWVEDIQQRLSPPGWVRGLQRTQFSDFSRREYVAPPVGGCIETPDAEILAALLMSHPVWVRGLKHEIATDTNWPEQVAPCVGAWIETTKVCIFRVRLGSRTLCAWIETSMITMQGTTQNVAPCVVRGMKQKIDATCSRCAWPHPVWGRRLKQAECIQIKRVNEDGKFVYPLLNH